MEHKRITIFCGHYGSGKSNLAVNFARSLRPALAGKLEPLFPLELQEKYY